MVLWSATVFSIQKVPFQNLALETRYSAWRLLTFLSRTAFTSKETTAVSFHSFAMHSVFINNQFDAKKPELLTA